MCCMFKTQAQHCVSQEQIIISWCLQRLRATRFTVNAQHELHLYICSEYYRFNVHLGAQHAPTIFPCVIRSTYQQKGILSVCYICICIYKITRFWLSTSNSQFYNSDSFNQKNCTFKKLLKFTF